MELGLLLQKASEYVPTIFQKTVTSSGGTRDASNFKEGTILGHGSFWWGGGRSCPQLITLLPSSKLNFHIDLLSRNSARECRPKQQKNLTNSRLGSVRHATWRTELCRATVLVGGTQGGLQPRRGGDGGGRQCDPE